MSKKLRMRISEFEKRVFIETVKEIDSEANIFLFGSRTDDNKRGGDIDLLVHSQKIDLRKEIEIQKEFFLRLEEQKIDLVVTKDFSEPFVQYIKPTLIPLI